MSDMTGRQSGLLSPTDATRDRLTEMRRRSGITQPGDLSVDEVRAVEAALGHRFHDDILAVFACGHSLLRDSWRVRISSVLGHTGSLQERGERGDWVGIGESEAGWVAVEKSATGNSDAVVLLTRDSVPSTLPCWQWLESLLAGVADEGNETTSVFEARLVAAALESTRAGVRVRHKVFGEGVVLSDTGHGSARRVKVEFPGHRLKLLAARFVEFIDD